MPYGGRGRLPLIEQCRARRSQPRQRRDMSAPDSGDAPAVTFVIPVRHHDNAPNWERLLQRLMQTAASIAAQTSASWRAVVVASAGSRVPQLPDGFADGSIFPPTPTTTSSPQDSTNPSSTRGDGCWRECSRPAGPAISCSWTMTTSFIAASSASSRKTSRERLGSPQRLRSAHRGRQAALPAPQVFER